MSASQELLALMKQISRREFNDPWSDGVEYYLWRAITGSVAPRLYRLERHEVARLQNLYRQAGGWWATIDDDYEPIFLTKAKWKALYLTEWDDWSEI